MKRLVYILIVSFLLIHVVKSQDPHFSQYYSIPTYLAPSFAGSAAGTRYVLNYRNQWPGVKNTYETYSFSFDKNLLHIKSGIGALLIRDQMSPALSKTIIGGQYSYNALVSKRQGLHIRPGLTFYYFNLNLDVSNVVLGHQIDGKDNILPAINLPAIKPVNKFDFNTSILAYTETIWAGLTVDHLTRSNESLTNTKSVTPIKYMFFGGYKFDFNRKQMRKWPEKGVTAAFIYKKQGDYDQLDLGCYWTQFNLTVGMWYRGIPVRNIAGKIDHDAIVFLTGYKLNQFKFAYSYDISISSVFLNSKGSHEISVTWELPYRDPRRKIVPVPCAQF